MKFIDKIKSWLGLGKSNHLNQDRVDVLLEISYRLETTHFDPNTTRFERYNIALNLTEKYYRSNWRFEPYDDFDDHIMRYLDEVYPLAYIKPIPILLTSDQCRYAILISEYLMGSYFVQLGWSRDDIMILSTQLAVNFEYDISLAGKVSLHDQIEMYMESTKALQIAEEYSYKNDLRLVDD